MHNISNETISLQKEIELVENYLLLEKLRFEDQLNYSIDIEDGLFLSEIMVPPLLVQPLVENSIKHGILPLKKMGKQGFIHISVYERGETLYIEVRDNGIGVAEAGEKKSLHESFGLENLRNRIQQLSIIQNKEISFLLTDHLDDNQQHWTVATIGISMS
jgi:LytS/YehU family sensor histidine kinase